MMVEGRDIYDSAQNRNPGGVIGGIIRGAVRLPIHTALRVVSAVFELPRAVVEGSTQEPQSPRQRASTYATAANHKWLRGRGLRAVLMSSSELAVSVMGIPVEKLLGLVEDKNNAARQMDALNVYISRVDVFRSQAVILDASTLWLVAFEETSFPFSRE